MLLIGLENHEGISRAMLNTANEEAKSSENYSVKNMGYDGYRNIKYLQRMGLLSPNLSPGMIDNLKYYYKGNQLIGVYDPVEGSNYGDYPHHEMTNPPDGTDTSTWEYTYDGNGNMTSDLVKSIINITYDHLNLPKVINFSNNDRIEYGYNSAGTKLRKQVYTTGTLTGATDYVNGFVYENNSPSYMLFDEGRILLANGTGTPEYHLKDHLGNVRVAFGADGTVKQVNSYYPFGMNIYGLTSTETTSTKNKYLYNGKEMQGDFNLNMLDYGARFYDAQIGRFHTNDRFAEKYASLTPYHYGANNPILLIDINGDSLWITHRTGFLGLGKKETLRYEDGNLFNRDGSSYSGKVKGFLSESVSALDKASSGSAGDNMINELQSSTDNVTIVKSNDGNSFNPGTFTVNFDPSSKNGGLNTRGATERPTFIGLGHELAHSLDEVKGTLNLNRIPGQTFTYAEQFSTHIENQMRAENGLPLRTYYGLSATGSGIYPLINSSGQSLHYNGFDYYGALRLTPKPVRALIPATTPTKMPILNHR